MIISVASGKGGTGKTTVAVNLALSADIAQFIDGDVEEPNAHLFLNPSIEERSESFILVPEVDEARCTRCGRCRQVCAYNAIAVLPGKDSRKGNILVFPQLCHGCGGCSMLCPENAIKETQRAIGIIESGHAGSMHFVGGRLNIAEAMSPPLIRQVKKHIKPFATVIIDAPPGTSCPVIEAVKGSDFCLLVTEPTPFGLNDLMLAVEMLKKLKIPHAVVINRASLGDRGVSDYCDKERIPVLAEIPFEREIAVAYSKGIPIVEAIPRYRAEFRELFQGIKDMIAKEPSGK